MPSLILNFGQYLNIGYLTWAFWGANVDPTKSSPSSEECDVLKSINILLNNLHCWLERQRVFLCNICINDFGAIQWAQVRDICYTQYFLGVGPQKSYYEWGVCTLCKVAVRAIFMDPSTHFFSKRKDTCPSLGQSRGPVQTMDGVDPLGIHPIISWTQDWVRLDGCPQR